MQKKFLYPVDTDQFEHVRRQGKVYVEVKSILGRADVVVQTDDDVFVMELKADDTVETALAQIDEKDYAIQWSADGRKVTKCGVSITSDKRNITHWRITDANGSIIEDQSFKELQKA